MKLLRKIRKNLAGKKFGRLSVIDYAGRNSQGRVTWNCVCSCGNKCVTGTKTLLSGETLSCGCLQRERTGNASRKHGASRTPIYKVWLGMMHRCYSPKAVGFKHYGGRGISVCDRWRKFENFRDDMSPRPEGLTIERINNDGNYEPGNVRWASMQEQLNNKRTNRFLVWNGEKKTLAQWAKVVGLNSRTLFGRLRAGHSVHESLSRPLDKKMSERAKLKTPKQTNLN